MQKYNSTFAEKVKAKIRAELVLDAKKKPLFISEGSLRHYKVKLRLETENPKVERVIYRLDPTYYDSVREATDKENGFEIETATYGDYPLVVDVQIGDETIRQEVVLSDLLMNEYGKEKSGDIKKALKDIEEH
jgi:transcription initiation factor IIF auxiliary subunit